MDVDLRKIRYFVAVAENLHFRKAAEELHIAQPALSRSIGALERELGTQLFIRDKRSVTLTPAGRQLLDDAGPLLAAADATRQRVQRAGRGAHHLVVGFRAGILVTAAVRALCAERPEVSVEVQRLEWDDQEELILSGRVDNRPCPPADPRARAAPRSALRRAAARRATRAGHRLAQRVGLYTVDLAGERHLRDLQPAPVPGISGSQRPLRSVEEKLEHVAAGHGIIVLPLSATQYYSRPDVVYVPVLDAELDQVYLASEATRRSKLITGFIRVGPTSPPLLGDRVRSSGNRRAGVRGPEAARTPWPWGARNIPPT